MNPVFFRNLFVGLVSLKILIKLILDWLNFSYLRKKAGHIPESIAGLIDIAQLQRIDSYTAEKLRLRTIGFLFDALILIGFLFTPLFAVYTSWVASFALAAFWKGLLFFLLISWAGWLLDLPWDYYFHFVIETRFGFNKYRPAGWLLDSLKNLLITSVLTVVILGIILWIWGPRTSFDVFDVLTAWGLMTAMIFLFMYLVPVLFIPFFYKLQPLEDGDLKQRITQLVTESGFAVRGVFVADESRKSSHANAQFAGIGKSKTIILFDTLVHHYSVEEILAVLAHEIGHGKKQHLLKMMLMVLVESLLFLIFAFYLLSADFTFQAFGIPKLFYSGLFVTYILFFDILTYYAHPLLSLFSRRMEYQADDFSKRLIGSAEPLVAVFKKFIVNELDNINPHPLYEAFYYSHPALLKRIAALQEK